MTSPRLDPLIAIHQLSLYNAGRMPTEQIIAAFAARRQPLERIVADLAAQKTRSRAQHHLVVGQRGMGKTMLLARIAAELRTSAELSARFIPLLFAEEQYAVDRLSRFWLNCLDALAGARELANDADGGAEIDAIVARLTAGGPRGARDDQPFADEVYEAFAQVVRAGAQRPVLLVDNLRLVFERLDRAQQDRLHERLMRPGSPIVVGASASPPPQRDDDGAAFYDRFTVHDLRPLDESETRALLVHLADVAQRGDVRQRILQHPARLTVLGQLTGGNPRTALTLFFLYAEDFAPNVFGDLEGLLDRVTPLYKARFEELTAQQQVIASAIAHHWDPVTAAGVAAATGLPATTISAQLDRLKKTGVVEHTELFGEASTGYQLAERFFNIWCLMRSGSRRQRREVELLARFLESFYESTARSSERPGSEQISGTANADAHALQADAANPDAQEYRLFLRRDFMGEGPAARPLLDALRALAAPERRDPTFLHEALFAAYDSNWGLARAALAEALGGFKPSNTDDWLRASAVLLHLNYGADLLVFLGQRGDTARLRPWVEALRAHQIGDRRALQNIAPEIRPAAGIFYDGIDSCLKKLPEKTRRRPIAMPRRTRSDRV